MPELDLNELNGISGGANTQARYIAYIVKEGDTQGKICQKYNITLEELQEVNRIKPGDCIKPGQRLLIPNKDFVRRT